MAEDALTRVDEPFDPVTGELLPTAKEWRIRGLEDLDWALRRLSTLESQANQNAELEAKAVAQFRERVAALNARLERGAAYFRGLITVFAGEHRAELLGNGKKKSRELPGGVIGWRSRPPSLEVIDADALLAWAKQMNLVRVKTEPDMKLINAGWDGKGEPPPGTRASPDEETLYIKPAGNALALKKGTPDE